jgi:putative transposase
MDSLPRRQPLHHTPPPWVKPGNLFFVTACCSERGRNQLAQPGAWAVIHGGLGHYHRTGRCWVRLALAMPDHLHALLAFPSDQPMAKVIRDWKRYVAKSAGISWQDGFFDHRLRQEESLDQKADYIRMNPVRAGLVTDPGAWAYVCAQHDFGAAGPR